MLHDMQSARTVAIPWAAAFFLVGLRWVAIRALARRRRSAMVHQELSGSKLSLNAKSQLPYQGMPRPFRPTGNPIERSQGPMGTIQRVSYLAFANLRHSSREARPMPQL